MHTDPTVTFIKHDLSINREGSEVSCTIFFGVVVLPEIGDYALIGLLHALQLNQVEGHVGAWVAKHMIRGGGRGHDAGLFCVPKKAYYE